MLRNNKVMNDNKCFILLYIYHLEQGIMLWIGKTPRGPALTVIKYPTDRTQNSAYFRRSEESHRHSKSQSCSYAVLTHIHSQSVTCWSTYWWQQKTPKNNNHVNSHFSSWCLLLTKTGVRISDNTLFTTQCKILMPAMMIKKKFINTLHFYVFLHDNSTKK